MFSLIVCSQNKQDLKALQDNVSATIGVPFELIGVDNFNNSYSIYEAYNRGAESARYPFLIFLHEDVRFVTQTWGRLLRLHFDKLQDPGILGIGGSCYMPSVPSGWFLGYGAKNHVRLNIYQGFNSLKQYELRRLNPEKVDRQEVAVLDGVMLAVRREVWAQFPFDEKNFSGFHFYDLDFCLQVKQRYKNYVVFDIDLVHRSIGQNRKDWVEAALRFTEKWERHLPLSITVTTSKEVKHIEWAQFYYFMKLVRSLYSYPAAVSLCLRKAPWHYFYLKGYLKAFYYFFIVFPVRKTIPN